MRNQSHERRTVLQTSSVRSDGRDQRRRELEAVEREPGRLTDAIAAAGAMPAVAMDRLRATEAKRRELAARVSNEARQRRTQPAWRDIERREPSKGAITDSLERQRDVSSKETGE